MKQEMKKIVTPLVLRKSVEAYRIGKGDGSKYLLRMPKIKETLKIEPWQFFVLEVLPGCESFKALCSVFEDRFGRSLPSKDVEELLSLIERKKLFSAGSLELPILNNASNWSAVRLAQPVEAGAAEAQVLNTGTSFKAVRVTYSNGTETPDLKAGDRSGSPNSGPQATQSSGSGTGTDSKIKAAADPSSGKGEDAEVAGVAGATGLDDRMPYLGFKLLNPTWLLRMLLPVMRPFRYLICLLPVLLILAGYISVNYKVALVEDSIRVFQTVSFAKHVLIGMVTVNLAVTMLSAMVAYNFRASVKGIYLIFYMLFIPRFSAKISNAQKLSRQELIWLHASPLLLRLGFFAAGILVWYFTRVRYDLLAHYGLVIASIGAISFFITVNPLVKSNGFHLLAAFANEPRLRGKSFHAFMNKFGGKVYTQADQNALVAYTMASALFIVVFVATMVYILNDYLNIYIGEGSLLLIACLVGLLMWRMTKKLKKVRRHYERSVQYMQWRNRTLPQKVDDVVSREKSSTALVYVKIALLVLFISVMFLPYDYEVGGKFTVLPFVQQKIAGDIAGIIEKVNYEGGEFVQKGEVVGYLSHSEYIAQEKIYAARVEEQAALVEKLKSQPRSEELQLALSELETQRTRTQFTKARVERLKVLYNKGSISFEDLEEARKDYEVDNKKIVEKNLNYRLVKAGATEEEIAASEAKLKAYQEQRDFYLDRIEQSIFTMPFTGKIITMHLHNKIGSYLNKGEALAIVENVNTVKVEIEIPESDISLVKPDAVVRIRSRANHIQDLNGSVLSIDQIVTEQRHSRIIKVTTLISNKSDMLKTGMTGYAKIQSEKKPFWKVLSMPLIRFANVDIWSWLP